MVSVWNQISLVSGQDLHMADSYIIDWLTKVQDAYTLPIYYVYHLNYNKNIKEIDTDNGI